MHGGWAWFTLERGMAWKPGLVCIHRGKRFAAFLFGSVQEGPLCHIIKMAGVDTENQRHMIFMATTRTRASRLSVWLAAAGDWGGHRRRCTRGTRGRTSAALQPRRINTKESKKLKRITATLPACCDIPDFWEEALSRNSGLGRSRNSGEMYGGPAFRSLAARALLTSIHRQLS
jgi:hypothetical protein